jgi:hypothetical protein
MFDTRKTSSDRIANAIDLTLDFATLGEYGLEPVTPPRRACEGRQRSGTMRSTGSWSAAIDRFAPLGHAKN